MQVKCRYMCLRNVLCSSTNMLGICVKFVCTHRNAVEICCFRSWIIHRLSINIFSPIPSPTPDLHSSRFSLGWTTAFWVTLISGFWSPPRNTEERADCHWYRRSWYLSKLQGAGWLLEYGKVPTRFNSIWCLLTDDPNFIGSIINPRFPTEEMSMSPIGASKESIIIWDLNANLCFSIAHGLL